MAVVNSYAVGIAVAQPLDFEIDLQVTLFLHQLHDFSLLLLNSFLQPFLKSKVM